MAGGLQVTEYFSCGLQINICIKKSVLMGTLVRIFVVI